MKMFTEPLLLGDMEDARSPTLVGIYISILRNGPE